MTLKLRRFRPVILALGLLATSLSRAAILENSVTDTTFLVEIDCEGDGNLEDFFIATGRFHTLVTETIDKKGGYHFTLQYQPVGLSGVGEITGDTYRAVGLTRQSRITLDDNMSDTYVNNFYIIGQRSGIKFLVHNTFHVTLVDGEVVVTVDHATAECR